MNGVTKTQKTLSCEEAKRLMEARVAEEALDAAAQSSLEIHLQECDRCHALSSLTFGLPHLAQEEAGEFDASIRAVLARAHEEQAESRVNRYRWVMAVAALFVVATGLFAWRFWAADPTPEADFAILDCDTSPPVEIVAGVSMIHCKGELPGTLIEDSGVRVTLPGGAVALSVDPQRPDKRRVSVDTPIGEARVKGTVFAVHVANEDARVEVFRGIVEMIPKDNPDEIVEVTAGKGGQMGRPATFLLREPTTRVLVDALPEPAAQPEIADAMSQGGAGRDSVEEQDATGSVQETDASAGLQRRHSRHAAAQRRAETADELIEGAQSCMLKKDWPCAASKYRSVISSHPKHPAANAALITLARLELRQLGQPGQAYRHYNAYLKRVPGGALAEEAYLGIADTYRKLGQVGQETQALKAFLTRFPGSALAGKARNRLRQLQDNGAVTGEL